MIYSADLTHVRVSAPRRGFTHRMRLWLVDVDDLPRSRLASVRAADHLGTPEKSVRANLEAWLAERGVPAPAKVLLLTQPRTFGYVFNPLSVYWCFDAAGAPVCVVAEVHNTYGERHCYLMDHENAVVDKEFYVSPFIPVSGRYRMRLPLPEDRVALSITLHQDGRPAFAATLTGRRVGRATPARRLVYAFSLAPHRVRMLIQRHGATLWLRRVPMVRREGVR